MREKLLVVGAVLLVIACVLGYTILIWGMATEQAIRNPRNEIGNVLICTQDSDGDGICWIEENE